MAISNSNLSSNNLASAAMSQIDQNLAKSDTANEIKDGLSQAQTIASGFTTIFSLLQQNEDSVATKSGSDNQDEALINSFQGSLLGSLGIAGASGGSIEEQLKTLTSEASIEKLQSAFLVSLQQNLFSARAIPTEGSTQGEGDTVVAEQEPTELTTFQKLEALSFGKDGLEANDGFDTVNILNHVPVVSEFYKNVTGHDISGISKLAGGYLYGGPTGLVFSALELTTQSLFDNSISGLLANFNYGQLFGSEEAEQVEQQEPASATTEEIQQPNQSVNSIYWQNRYVREQDTTSE